VERLGTSNFGERPYPFLNIRAKLRSLLRTKVDPKIKAGSRVLRQGEFDTHTEFAVVEADATSASQEERLAKIAERSLDFFEDAAGAAGEALGEDRRLGANVLAVVNTLNADKAVRNLEGMNEARLRELRVLCTEPAIARIVVEDEHGTRKTYFISRATPHRSPRDGSAAASYRAPIGRLAALPVGGDLDVKTPVGVVNLQVIERALLRPAHTDGEWDSINSAVQGEGYGPLTVSSFREFLRLRGVAADEADLLEAALAEDRAAGVVAEGLRRNAITKMELRDQAVLDEYQDEIFRLPLDTRLVILGPPGTGKTTTLIKRLGLKLDHEYLTDEEKDLVATTAAGSVRHAQSWIMFTPTDLLRQYVKEAFARENIAASDERISTWDDFRRDLARNRFGILRSGVGGGIFVIKDDVPPLQTRTLAQQREWFADFEAWQSEYFWNDLRANAQALGAHKNPEIARLGARLLETLPAALSATNAAAFPGLAGMADEAQAFITSLKNATDAKIRSAIGQELKKDKTFLDRLVDYIATLADTDEGEDEDGDGEDDRRQIRVGKDAAADALMRAIRGKARAQAIGRALNRETRNGRIIDWLGERGVPDSELVSIGESIQVQAAARRFVSPLQRYYSGLPGRYRRYRRARQSEGRWYGGSDFPASDLHPLEVDLILLALLKAGRSMLEDRRIARAFAQGEYRALAPIRELYRTQVVVDEATDFSPVQLACMAHLCDPAANSFVACGDFNQRITLWGSRSDADLKWVYPDVDIRSITITYRHSRQLNELARSIAQLSSPDTPEAQLPPRTDNDGFSPVLATGIAARPVIGAWLSARIEEIERLSKVLPPIAILVSDEEDVIPLADFLNGVLRGKNIRVVPCSRGQLAGQDNDVRVFDVKHIKGLEFEAVFFVGVDRLAQRYPDLFEKYLYVGATRAAMFLGMTSSADMLPEKMAGLAERFGQKWP
jgi:UvrD-like helicase C-terminal domain